MMLTFAQTSAHNENFRTFLRSASRVLVRASANDSQRVMERSKSLIHAPDWNSTTRTVALTTVPGSGVVNVLITRPAEQSESVPSTAIHTNNAAVGRSKGIPWSLGNLT